MDCEHASIILTVLSEYIYILFLLLNFTSILLSCSWTWPVIKVISYHI